MGYVCLKKISSTWFEFFIQFSSQDNLDNVHILQTISMFDWITVSIILALICIYCYLITIKNLLIAISVICISNCDEKKSQELLFSYRTVNTVQWKTIAIYRTVNQSFYLVDAGAHQLFRINHMRSQLILDQALPTTQSHWPTNNAAQLTLGLMELNSAFDRPKLWAMLKQVSPLLTPNTESHVGTEAFTSPAVNKHETNK